MFAYNELSDLVNGDLVTPLKKVGDDIICLTKDGKEAVFSFEDFDFDKTVEERNFIVVDDDPPEEEKKEDTFEVILDSKWLDKGDAELLAVKGGWIPGQNIKGMREFTITNF